MTKILASAVLTCRQEGDNLFLVIAPAAFFGPIGAFTAVVSPAAAVFLLPALVLLYFVSFAASVRAAGLVHSHLSPEPGRAHLGVLRKWLDILRLAGPGVLMLAAVSGAALFIAESGEPRAAIVLATFGGSTFFIWAARHAYDLPLVLMRGLGARDAFQVGLGLFRGSVAWTMSFAVALTSPLALAALAAWGLSGASPAFGAAVFAICLALWLPLPALSLTSACARLLGEAE